MLKERAEYYYIEERCNCAEALFLAINDCYGLGVSKDGARSVSGFGGGMGCGAACGALCGAVAALGYFLEGREALHEAGERLVGAFREALHSIDCREIARRNMQPECRCVKTVLLAAELFEEQFPVEKWKK